MQCLTDISHKIKRAKYCSELCGRLFNKERARKRTTDWCIANKERHAANVAKFKKDNPDYDSEQSAKWHAENPQYNLMWRSNNRDKMRIHYQNRRVWVKEAGKLSKESVDLMFLIFGRNCLKCGNTNDLTVDHIVPLSRGGSNYIYNLQPLCKRCNSIKGNRNCEDFRSFEVTK
jgi:5-methylcytosine-specific restriction endonuclease McrA